MNYSLGNMLGGAGALNADKLALNLQFATDKTLTARKGPTPVFTRASGATQVGASGLIEFAPENTLQRSEEFDNATYWSIVRTTVTANATTSPTGTLTADKLVTDSTASSNHRIDRATINLSLGTVYTLSIYVKASEYSGFAIGVDASSPVIGVQFSLSGSGSVTAQLAGYTGAIQDAGNGWFRCSATFTSNASLVAHRVYMYLGQNGTTFTYTGDGTSGIFIWGAQLERYASARTYIPTTNADVFNARFDHDPITLACKGLLIEESRTNLTARSEGLDATPWAVQNATTITSNNTASPDGNITAELFTVGATSTVYGIQNSSVSWTSGTTYTVSCFFKAREITRVNITVNNTGVLPINATFDLTGSGSIVGTPTGTAVIQRYGNGWYRCSVSATALSTALTAFRFSAVSGTSTTYPGNSVDSFYGWGAQVEVGAFPTSYIPTTTASVVRSVDICSITGANFTSIWNGVDATVFFRGSRIINISGQSNWALSSGTLATAVVSDRSASFERLAVAGSGIINRSPFTTLQEYKIATAIKTSDYAASFNGEAAITSASTFALSLNAFSIGTTYTGGGQLNGWIHSIRFFKKRLPNAKLVTLTA